jgi:hypothetical protein
MARQPKKTKVPARVNVGISAKAKFEARVSTEIPSQSSGRLIDAVTDIFRPFSEKRGLKADQIRLQREDVLLEIAKRAHQRLRLEDAPISPIPNKILVPFLEKASLEDENSFLLDRWADLLVSAARSTQAVHPRLIQVLSELTPAEALLLRHIAMNGEFARFRLHDSVVEFEPHTARFRIDKIIDELLGDCDFLRDDEAMYQLERSILDKKFYLEIDKLFAFPGVAPVLVFIAVDRTDVWSSEPAESSTISNEIYENDRAVSVLQSLRIIEKNHIDVVRGTLEIEVYYLNITELGIDLLINCDREIGKR